MTDANALQQAVPGLLEKRMAKPRGAPRKVPISLAGSTAPPPRPAGSKPSALWDPLEVFHSKGLMPWFDVGAARVYQRVMTAGGVSNCATVGLVQARAAVRMGDARQGSVARALDARDLANDFRAFVIGQLGVDAEGLLMAVLVDRRRFPAVAQMRGNRAWNAARVAAQDFRSACADLARALASPPGARLMEKLR